MSAHDIMVACENIGKSGYPLRIGVSCNQFQFTWPSHEISLSMGRIVADAPIYAPHFLEFNIYSPVSIVFSGKTPMVSQWRNLVIETESYWKASRTFKLMVEGFEISTISSFFEGKKNQELWGKQTKNGKVSEDNMEQRTSLKDVSDAIEPSSDQKNLPKKLTTELLQLDFQQEKNHLSGHITFDGFSSSMFFTPYFRDIPKIDGSLKWVLNDIPYLFRDGESIGREHIYGKGGVLERGELIFHTGGELRVSGPFSFNNEGYLTAKFELVLVKHADLLTTMQRLFPHHSNNLQALFFILGIMPKSPDGDPILPLHITDGWVKLGFLKLGRLAPL